MGEDSQSKYPHSGLTEKIIGAAFKIHNRIGSFLQLCSSLVTFLLWRFDTRQLAATLNNS